MNEDTDFRPSPQDVALLRGGPRAAVTVAVLALHLRGAVETGRPGTLRKANRPDGGPPDYRHPLEKAVRVGLYRPAGPRELLSRSVVRQALARMRREATAAGLLRSVPPGRTRAARRRLAELRERRPLPADGDVLPDEDALFAVALYGGRALTALVPVFARDSGLLGRGALADEGLFPHGLGSGLRGLIGDEGTTGRDEHGHGSGSDHGHAHGYGHDHGGGGYGCGGGGGGGGSD
ncbi:TIGR04222 domain-containing membrane protein [Streptomyces sp. NBC_00289]|uniref:TIGR04222 domain-containing membrane protein n=1 Tax=Streptomyces sp. NBC_00289 TaxID=2975703 RepID=UPI0032524DE6